MQQTSGDIAKGALLRGVLPASASLAQPKQSYSNGTQTYSIAAAGSEYQTTLGGTIGGTANGMNLMAAGANYTVDPGGANQKAIALTMEPPPVWNRPSGILLVPRNAPLALAFTQGDKAALTVIRDQCVCGIGECDGTSGMRGGAGRQLFYDPGRRARQSAAFLQDRGWVIRQSADRHGGGESGSYLLKWSGFEWHSGGLELGGANGGDPMKSRVTIPVLVWLLFAVVPLFGQPVPASGTLYVNAFGNVTLPPLADYIIAYSFYQLNGIKILTYQPYKCTDAVDFYGDEFALALSIPVPGDPGALCYPLLDNGLPVNFSSVQMLLQKLNNWASGAPQQVNALEEPIRSPRPSLATVQPVAPPNPTARNSGRAERKCSGGRPDARARR